MAPLQKSDDLLQGLTTEIVSAVVVDVGTRSPLQKDPSDSLMLQSLYELSSPWLPPR